MIHNGVLVDISSKKKNQQTNKQKKPLIRVGELQITLW